MALKDELLTLKNKEGTLTGNKVCNFAYDDTAFEDDTTTGANGVTIYNYNNHNNIPVKDPTVLKTNTTIISKGFRSQVSVLPRMLLNHIFGRISYNLNKTVDTFNSLLSNLYNYIGQPNGLATLDNTGRLPYSQLPLSAVEYKGAWNANTNTPTLASGTGTFGDEYIVSVQGTRNIGEGSIIYRVGDRVIYNGSIWQRIPASSVRTVNSKTPDANGNVTVNASDMVTPDVYGYDKTDIGKYWEKIPNLNFVTMASTVRWIKDKWFVCCTNTIYWSEDGITFTEATGFDSSAQVSEVIYLNRLFIATGMGLWWSADGKSWNRATYTSSRGTDLFAEDTQNVAFQNGIYFCKGFNKADSYAWFSSDGKAWTEKAFSTSNSGGVNALSAGNGVFVMAQRASGVSWGIMWSADGESWTPITWDTTPTGGSYIETSSGNNIIVFEDGIFVMLVATGTVLSTTTRQVYYSYDGKYWYKGSLTLESYENLSRVSYTNGRWFIGGYNSGSQGTSTVIFTSNNGISWTRCTVNAPATYPVTGACKYGGGIYVICGNNQRPLYSSDGNTWNISDTIPMHTEVDYSKGKWLGTASYLSYDAGLWQSVGLRTNNVATILDWLLYAVDNLLE